MNRNFLNPVKWQMYIKNKIRFCLDYPQILFLRIKASVIFKRGKSRYQWISEKQILNKKKSDTLFVFGCGASLNQISKQEWDRIKQCDTFAFNWFNYQEFLPIDFYMVREITAFTREYKSPFGYIRKFLKYGNLFKRNFYKNTVFLIQDEWKAISSKIFAGLGFLPEKADVFPFKSIARGQLKNPTSKLSHGLVHGPGTLAECVNFGTIMGYKNIVLAGVDLYDQRYFWLPFDKTRPDLVERKISASDIYPGIKWTLDYFSYIKPFLKNAGVNVSVYNPKSLLNEVFPVFEWPAGTHAGPIAKAMGQTR